MDQPPDHEFRAACCDLIDSIKRNATLPDHALERLMCAEDTNDEATALVVGLWQRGLLSRRQEARMGVRTRKAG